MTFKSHKNEYSKLSTIWTAVPQGNILGPTLYLVYADTYKMGDTTVATFADDAAVFIVDQYKENSMAMMQATKDMGTIDA